MYSRSGFVSSSTPCHVNKMPTRYFLNNLPDYRGGPVTVPQSAALKALRETIDYVLSSTSRKRPTLYTGTAGLAYTCWHLHRHAAAISSVMGEGEIVEAALQLSRSSLKQAEVYPVQHHGWALLDGHAGVFATAALCFNAAVHYEERRGRMHLAAGLREEMNECLQRYGEVGTLAMGPGCQEDEFLYGRAGYVFGGLLLNHHIRPDAVAASTLQGVTAAMVQSGRELARRQADVGMFPTPLLYVWPPGEDSSPYLGAAHGLMGRRQASQAGLPTPLYFHWHDKPYLGAAHGMIGILYTLLHVPGLVEGDQRLRGEVEAALAYILTLECDAQGVRGLHGHYPTQMGPWRDREPLVHWCHGATGAVFLFCKAYEVLGQARFLEAAGRSGEAVWGHGLLKKGPGACHGVSGSAYALLHLYRTTSNPMWLYRALQFAEFMDSTEFERGARTPDHPQSLFEGWAAAACLWSDLLEPDTAVGFPCFEMENA